MTSQQWGAMLPALLLIVPLIGAVFDLMATGARRRPVA